MPLSHQKLFSFLDQSSTVFHATSEIKNILENANFIQLHENKPWKLVAKNRYYVMRNNSAIIAFTLSENFSQEGFKIVGAHTDFPALKLKPNSDLFRNNTHSIAVEPYGGGMWNTWFDRELSVAGKVCFVDKNNVLSSTLIDFKRPIAIIPSTAPHLDKSFDSERTLNKQIDLPPIIAIEPNHEKPFNDYLKELIPQETEIIDSELFFYPVAKATTMGIDNDFIVSSKLDNLLSCFVITQAISNSNENNCIAVFNDHEECGSISTTGAGGSFLADTLHRICGKDENFYISNANSLMVSLDNAHAVHPNNPSRHEPSHQPKLNGGPVIKINANQRYATNSEGAATLKIIAKSINVPLQTFVARSDLGCGSTIGPVSSAILGINTIDLGIPTYAMHSCREIATIHDTSLTTKLITAFYNYKN